MAVKLFALFVVAVAVALTQGQVTQITLPDVESTFISNPIIGKSISIPKSFLDTLELCRVVFPNGFPYEAYPNNNIPPGPISFMPAVQPFTSCAISFLNVPNSASGTYQLMSTVRHSADNSVSLTTQRFHLTFVQTEVVFPVDAPAEDGSQ